MSEVNQTANISSTSTDNSVSSGIGYLFSNKNTVIIILLVLLILALIGINVFAIFGDVISNILNAIFPAFSDLLSMIGFTGGQIINNSADILANTADFGIDIAKGTTHSIGDLLINSNNPSIDSSKQVSISEVIGVPSLDLALKFQPKPVETSEPIVTPISSQKPMAGWCYIGEFSEARGCVEVTEHDKCMSGQIFASKSACLNPDK
jgi:hypothetical protein